VILEFIDERKEELRVEPRWRCADDVPLAVLTHCFVRVLVRPAGLVLHCSI
jgi:hypothetical protein